MSPIKAAAATMGMILLMAAIMAVSAFGYSLWHERFVCGVSIFFVACGIVGLYKAFRI